MSKTLKLITYNVDGLPSTLDLNDLPWILKPIAWIYFLFKGTTIITINDNGNKKNDIRHISEYLSFSDADIISVQEDFNYHDELIDSLENTYAHGKYLGGFDLSNLFSKTEWLTHFPFPRFKCDGLNIFTKINRVTFDNENINRWKKSYGYFAHANDALTHKGFRYYKLTVDEEINIDAYVLHMDADFYDAALSPDISKDLNARRLELRQLVNHIAESNTINPIIIMGDTNSYDKFEWDKANIQKNLIDAVNGIEGLSIQEAIPTNHCDCDKIFYINNDKAKYQLQLDECYFDMTMKASDHLPFVAKLNIKEK